MRDVVPDLEIHLVGAVEDLLENALQLRVDLRLRIAHLGEHAPVLVRLEPALGPGLELILRLRGPRRTQAHGHGGHHHPPEN